MKATYLAATVIIILIVFFSLNGFNSIPRNQATLKSNNGFAVVELFTSEGCSSCPSADKVVADLLSKNTENVYILSYHVDYWDRLGWKDAFSKPEFSARQSQYASLFSSESVYTPQVIVNGSTEFVGSDESKLNATISNDLQKEPTSDITISTSKNNNTIAVSFDIKEENLVLLNVALVQPEATSNVKRGENGGRILHHVNIVRSLKTLDANGKGTINIEIPKELSNTPLEIIAFTQAKSNLKILGADKKIIGL
ncbi:MAG: DUF1223 domain-containing protein [Ginsengibacter sp.]